MTALHCTVEGQNESLKQKNAERRTSKTELHTHTHTQVNHVVDVGPASTLESTAVKQSRMTAGLTFVIVTVLIPLHHQQCCTSALVTPGDWPGNRQLISP